MQTPRPTLAARLALSAITAYRNTLSHMMLHSCRFIPTCSVYAREAIEAHGAIFGIQLAVCRLLRCHPLARGGSDPIR